MARKQFRSIKLAVLMILIISGTWAFQRWTASEEIVMIDGRMVRVIDGDSFRMGTDEFRIHGIDAPEYRQSCSDARGETWLCGRSARAGLEAALRKGEYSCDVRARDQFGRMIVICRDRQENDLGSLMVEAGHAVSGRHFDESAYGREESRAQTAKRGIWQGAFQRPDVWRSEHPRK